ncbi:hypothetical protein DBR32_08515 [Taibaiella sp. KBW10]|uniref:hypothetical protein n=1 Tax=Taibaiella sp. KBW10 TaxID=2153357 RepID=UPI000F594EEB|nr:hypothetical protein [Taibaiella sp. KBW10]RQO30761.1 hypothetical protein DBR32_08515 [Taibaiella sp. KBW10]
MKTGLWILSAVAILCFASVTSADAQGRGKGRGHQEKAYYKQDKRVYKQTRKTVVVRDAYRRGGGPPAWAPAHGYRMKQHLYFPDYYAYYDPRRNGYVYWNNSAWIFSPVVPPYMSGVDLNRARVQVIGDLPLNKRPEANWRRYYRAYPPSGRVQVNINLPIR